jgi:ankyrin repeat protein
MIFDAMNNNSTNFDIFKLLIKAGADVNCLNDYSRNPLMMYLLNTKMPCIKIVKLFIEAGT